MTRSTVGVLWLLLLGASGARADAALVVVLPSGTPGALVDALRVELRARPEPWAIVLEPPSVRTATDVWALAAPHRPTRVLWVDDGDDPLRPPVMRLLEADVSPRVAQAPAALDALSPRMFALSAGALLDVPAAPAAAVGADADVPAPVPVADPAEAETGSPPAASDEPAAAHDDTRIADERERSGFVVSPRLGLVGGGGNLSPFLFGATLDLDMEIAEAFVVTLGGMVAYGVDRADPAIGLASLGLGARFHRVPGSLTVIAEAGAVFVAGPSVGFGPGLQARWEWPIDAFLRIGPRVSGHVLWLLEGAGGFTQEPNGWMITVGIDVLGVDLRLL